MEEKVIGGTEKVLIFLVLISLIFLQRFAIPVGGFQLPLVLLFSVVSVMILFFSKKIEMDKKRLTVYLIAISGLCIASLYGLHTFKNVGITSLVSLVVFYIPFLFINKNKGSLSYIFSVYQGSMIIVAILGIMQFSLQLAGLGFIDPIQKIPAQLLLTDYNTQNPLYFGSPYIKANGMFLLEPSFFSKMLALGIVIEFLTRKRLLVLSFFFIGMLVSFSGTGFIILAIASIPILLKLKPIKIMMLVILLSIPTYFLFDQGYGDIFIDRIEEFNTPNTSANVRFVAPWLTYKEFIDFEDQGTIIFGLGAGTLTDYHGREYTFDELSTVYYTAHATPYIKLFVEYGLIGGLFFVFFLIYTLISHSQYRLLTACLFINYSFLSNSLLEPPTIILCFILGVFATGNWKAEVEEMKRPRNNVVHQSGVA